jgi:3-keto-L-gulonate-6-phosphate decarboxylase
VDDVRLLKDVGVGAVLVGEAIVKQNDPKAGVRALYGRSDQDDECDKDPSADECRVYDE